MSRKIISLVVLFCSTLFADNPIVQTLYTADPAPMVYEDTLFCYTSHDEDVLVDNFFTMRDWCCYSTTDMVNWQDRGRVASLKDFRWTGDNGAWAVQCIPRDGKFYMYCPIHVKGIGVLVGDSPVGPFSDPIGRALLNNGGNDIDPTVFIDDDDQAYLYWGNPTCTYAKLNEDMISLSGNRVQVPMTVESFGRRSNTDRPTSYEEGPWLYKRNDLYYLVFAGGPISEHIAYSTGSSPTGPWSYRGVIMPTQGGSFTNHPGVIEYKGNSYLFYHNAALPGGGGFKRSVCVEEFEYNADGTIPRIDMTKNGASQIGSLDPYVTIQAETICWSKGVETGVCEEGGVMVDSIHNNDYIKVKGVDFGEGAKSFEARVASGGNGGRIELRLDSENGRLIGTCEVQGTGGWQSWTTETCEINDADGKHDLYLKFTGGNGFLFNFNWWKFVPIHVGIGQSGVKLNDGAERIQVKTSTSHNGIVHVAFPGNMVDKNAQVRMHRMDGRLVATLFEGLVPSPVLNLRMDRNIIRPGVYTIQVSTGNGEQVTDRAIIR